MEKNDKKKKFYREMEGDRIERILKMSPKQLRWYNISRLFFVLMFIVPFFVGV